MFQTTYKLSFVICENLVRITYSRTEYKNFTLYWMLHESANTLYQNQYTSKNIRSRT